MTEKKKGSKIIIEGVTEDGVTFRPSDWAERMSGSLSTFKNHRIYYSPLLRPSFRGGNRCVILDESLKESNPELYEHILDFARRNKLKICGEDEDVDK
ncbi:MAG TPA: DUF3579 domain-containing protein [Gammaproteobacteria bacterium]|nr:DUF3579 domain-containing protein [Gammaproteobacteria bacterium]